MVDIRHEKLKIHFLQARDWLSSKYGFTATFTAIALLIILSHVRHYPLIELPVESQLGILQHLPVEYYIAIALSAALLIANFRNERKGYFYFSMLLLIFLFVCLEAVFFVNPVGNADAYGFFLESLMLGKNSTPFFSYSAGAYPYIYGGSFLYMKALSLITGINTHSMIPFLSMFKIITTLSFFSLLYVLLKKYMGLTLARLITVLMVFANPYFHFHFSPHAFGLVLLLLLIYTVIIPREFDRKAYAIQLMLFILLSITHGPSTLYFALAYLLTSMISHIFRRRGWASSTPNVNIPMATVFTAGMLLMNPAVTDRAEDIVRWFSRSSGGESFANAINFRVTVPDAIGFDAFGLERLGNNFILPETIRALVLASCLIVAVWGAWKILRFKKMDGFNIFLLGSLGSVFFFSFGNFLYPHLNLGDRAFLYLIFCGVLMLRNFTPRDISLIGLMRLCKPVTSWKKLLAILTILLILIPLANGLAYHYHNGIYFAAPQYGDRHLYVYGHSSDTMVYSYRDNHYSLYSVSINTKEPVGMIPRNLNWFRTDDPRLESTRTFVVLAEPTEWSYCLFERDAELREILTYADTNMNLVYSSVGTSAWFSQPSAALPP